MIWIEEIPVERIDEFWSLHMKYLVDDGIIEDEEDIEYFAGDEYRGIIRSHMIRKCDRHHMVYFVEDGQRIGAAQYNTYQSEDGKCFILDFWVFPAYRGKGRGTPALKPCLRIQGPTGQSIMKSIVRKKTRSAFGRLLDL